MVMGMAEEGSHSYSSKVEEVTCRRQEEVAMEMGVVGEL